MKYLFKRMGERGEKEVLGTHGRAGWKRGVLHAFLRYLSEVHVIISQTFK